jgi:MMP alpha-(1->4)-mannosyltransferase
MIPLPANCRRRRKITPLRTDPPTGSSASLRICLLTYRGNPHCGGQGVYARYLSAALKELGHRVDVISGPPYPILDPAVHLVRIPSLDLYNPDDLFRMPSVRELLNPINLLEWLDVSSMGFPEPFTFGLRVKKHLNRYRQHYDIIHDNQSLSYGILSVQKWLPTVATIHHPITVDRKLAVRSAPSFFKKLQQMRWYSFIGMQKRVSRGLSHIVTVSNRARHDIAQDFSIPPERFRVVPNGIDTERFHPIPTIPREKDRIIVINSADTPLKGLPYLMAATARLSQERNIRMFVIGTPDKNGSVARIVRQLGLGSSVTLTGRVSTSDLVKHYAKAAVAVVPSVYEGFGFPAGEAMACGTPVICTAAGALPELVGDAGMVVPPADPAALYEAMKALLKDPIRASRMRDAGLARIHNRYTWKAAAQKTLAVYREAIRDYHRL